MQICPLCKNRVAVREAIQRAIQKEASLFLPDGMTIQKLQITAHAVAKRMGVVIATRAIRQHGRYALAIHQIWQDQPQMNEKRQSLLDEKSALSHGHGETGFHDELQ